VTLEAYKKAMAELGVDRAALDTGIQDFSRASVARAKVSQLLPQWRRNRRKVGRQPRTK